MNKTITTDAADLSHTLNLHARPSPQDLICQRAYEWDRETKAFNDLWDEENEMSSGPKSGRSAWK